MGASTSTVAAGTERGRTVCANGADVLTGCGRHVIEALLDDARKVSSQTPSARLFTFGRRHPQIGSLSSMSREPGR
jgi:hypothetical protein